MSESRHVHCDCGATSAFVRIWEPEDIDRKRMRTFIKATIRTFESYGLGVDRQRFAAVALAGFDRIPRGAVCGPRRRAPIDDALAEAADAAVRSPPEESESMIRV